MGAKESWGSGDGLQPPPPSRQMMMFAHASFPAHSGVVLGRCLKVRHENARLPGFAKPRRKIVPSSDAQRWVTLPLTPKCDYSLTSS